MFFSVQILMSVLPTQTQDELIKKRHAVLEELDKTADFYMELEWEVRTVGKICFRYHPCDCGVCT